MRDVNFLHRGSIVSGGISLLELALRQGGKTFFRGDLAGGMS